MRGYKKDKLPPEGVQKSAKLPPEGLQKSTITS